MGCGCVESCGAPFAPAPDRLFMMLRLRRIKSHTASTYDRPCRIINGANWPVAARGAVVMAFYLLLASPAPAADPPVIVAFGDSLSAGFGLENVDSFPVQLARSLIATGVATAPSAVTMLLYRAGRQMIMRCGTAQYSTPPLSNPKKKYTTL